MRMSRLVLLAALVIPACFLKNNTYTYPKGNIPVEITNGNLYPICMIDILPPMERKHELVWNPLKIPNPPAEVAGDAIEPQSKVEPIKTGHSLQIALKPGVYTIEAASCDERYTGSVSVSVDGPTIVGLGHNKPRAPAGTVAVALPLSIHVYHETASEPAGPAQGENTSSEEAPPPEAPSGPTCLPDGSHTGDYGNCCNNFKGDNTGHYVCCTPYKTC